ncbi:MAG: L-ribulose-5-phosphate 4-epimerase AraD [Elusimicrobia bacterium]|nr:L-ribulose-5-phosphate 4-epimerase AraD [Elusimicrobiota bacterium]
MKELKETVWRCNLELSKKGLVVYAFGNVSAIDRGRGLVAIKPSGVLYEELTPKQIAIVDLDNKIVDGKCRPSSDTKTHVALYKNFPKIGGIAHTHSTYATAWAQAMEPIPCFGTTHADYLPTSVPCTKAMTDRQLQGDYEEETGNQIVDAFKKLSYEEVKMVLVACHGPFTWGKTPEEAVHNSVVLEELAKMAVLSLAIKPDLKKIRKGLIDKHFSRKHGKAAYYGQSL